MAQDFKNEPVHPQHCCCYDAGGKGDVAGWSLWSHPPVSYSTRNQQHRCRETHREQTAHMESRLSLTSRETSCPQSSKHLLSLLFKMVKSLPQKMSENVSVCCHLSSQMNNRGED